MTVQEILEQVDNEVVIEIMEENGSPLYSTSVDGRTGQTCLWFRTICHGGDSHKLCYFTESKDFYCYTSCGRMRFFDFIKKILHLKDSEFYKALSYVANKAGINLSNDKYGFGKSTDDEDAKQIRAEINDIDRRLALRTNYTIQANDINTFYDKNLLNYFSKAYYIGWYNEGISVESMQKFGIRYYDCENHIIIPHFNMEGNLVGIRRRSLNPEDANNKYMPETIQETTYAHALGLNLYGLYENQKAITNTKTAIIVEGEKSVLLSDSYFGDNSVAVATCGFSISNWQINKLKSLGVSNIYIAFDKDFDIRNEREYMRDRITWLNYTRYLEKLTNIYNRLASDFSVKIMLDTKGLLDLKDSPFDKGKETYLKLKEQADKLELNIYLPNIQMG